MSDLLKQLISLENMTLVLILASLLPASYAYYRFRRMELALGLDVRRPLWVLVRILLTLAVWHFTSQITTTGAVFLYLVMAVDIAVILIDLLIRKLAAKAGKNLSPGAEKCRKILVELSVLPVLLIAGTFIYGAINIRNVVETRYTVTTEKAVPREGFRVCFLSDVHCGVALDAEDYERISREIESKEPDLVILGGDLLDFNSEQAEIEAMFASFGSIRAEKGVYYIFGNHDRTGDYKESLYTEDWIIGQCEKNGITVLQDEKADLGNGILLIGREDATTRYGRIRMTVEELFRDADTDRFILVADHQPSDYKELASHGADLVLGGHLHAGQIFPFNLLIELTNKEHVVYGRYLITRDGNEKTPADGPAKTGEGTGTAIVSSGLAGWSYPIRTSGPAEYCIIDICQETK